MLKPQFLLTKKIPITILRKSAGSYVEGEWIPGVEAPLLREVNIQPFKDQDLLMLPEAERSKEWYKLYCAEELKTLKPGTAGWSADEFVWEGDRYKVMKVKMWKMGILDHWQAAAARIELSAG